LLNIYAVLQLTTNFSYEWFGVEVTLD